MNVSKYLGQRINQARKKAGLTQVNLAKQVGIAYPTLNKYENGHRTPDADLLSKIVDIVKCDAAWLLTGHTSLYEDNELNEIIDILQNDLPDAKKHILKILKGQIEINQGIGAIQHMRKI